MAGKNLDSDVLMEKVPFIPKIVYQDSEAIDSICQLVNKGILKSYKTVHRQKGADYNYGGSIGVGIKHHILEWLPFTSCAEAKAQSNHSNNEQRHTETQLTSFLLFLSHVTSGKYIAKNIDEEVKVGDIVCIKNPNLIFDESTLMTSMFPLMSMLKIQEGEFGIDFNALTSAYNNIVGYREIECDCGNKSILLRFNSNSFVDSYRLLDLLKMDLMIYAVKVASNKSKESLMESFTSNSSGETKYSPKWTKENSGNKSCVRDVYDVLLAGVEWKN